MTVAPLKSTIYCVHWLCPAHTLAHHWSYSMWSISSSWAFSYTHKWEAIAEAHMLLGLGQAKAFQKAAVSRWWQASPLDLPLQVCRVHVDGLEENYSLQMQITSQEGFTKEVEMVPKMRMQRSVNFWNVYIKGFRVLFYIMENINSQITFPFRTQDPVNPHIGFHVLKYTEARQREI